MKIFTRMMFVSVLMILAAPAYSDSVVHVFECEQDEDATDQQIVAIATEWLAAAKKQKGGEGLEIYVNFPIAAEMGESDFDFVLIAPSFADWGVFQDSYVGSPASKVDTGLNDLADCVDSSLWQSVKIE